MTRIEESKDTIQNERENYIDLARGPASLSVV